MNPMRLLPAAPIGHDGFRYDAEPPFRDAPGPRYELVEGRLLVCDPGPVLAHWDAMAAGRRVAS